MSPLSAAYCARAKSYLAALGSTLGGRASPTPFSKAEAEVAALDPAKRVSPTEETVAQPPKLVSTAPAGRAEAPQAISVAAVATSKPPNLLSTVEDALPPPKSANSMEAATAETTKKQERTFLVLAQEQMEMRKLKGAEYWVAHERRVAAILAALKR
jgi:hypothetical protein